MFWEVLFSWLFSTTIFSQANHAITAHAADPQWFLIHEKPLRFTKEGTFQITIFEDLHYGEGWYNYVKVKGGAFGHRAENLTWGPVQDINSEKVIDTVLDAESPQIVILNGDLITGENTYLTNSSLYVDKIVKPLLRRGLTWASTYGNHDSNFNLSSWAMLEREHQYPNSRTSSMVSSPNVGVTNYYLPVFSSNLTLATPELIIYFFDSRGGQRFQELDASGNQISIPGYVDPLVVQWFRDTQVLLRESWGKNIPSLAFVHIPIYAMAAFQSAGVNANHEPGINFDNPLAPQGVTDGAYTGGDIPFMTALLDTPGLMAVFSGHDHGDDWCFKWNSTLPGMNLTGNGLNLCFGRHSGHGGYSGAWLRGSLQILLNKTEVEKFLETWVRLENGGVSGRITLNSTYGEDNYPPVNY